MNNLIILLLCCKFYPYRKDKRNIRLLFIRFLDNTVSENLTRDEHEIGLSRRKDFCPWTY